MSECLSICNIDATRLNDFNWLLFVSTAKRNTKNKLKWGFTLNSNPTKPNPCQTKITEFQFNLSN